MANMNGAPTTPMYEWYRPCWFCPKVQRLTQAWRDYFNSATYKNAMSNADLTKIPIEMRDIVTKPFPFMTKGDYKVQFKLKRAIEWNGVDNFNFETATPSTFTYQNPIETLFANEYQTVTFTKNDCGSGYDGGTVTLSVQPGTYTSLISQADANQKAIDYLNSYGQSYANQTGTCCINGNCFVPGTVTVTLSAYFNCDGSSSTITFAGSDGSYYTYEFPTYWYGQSIDVQIPAGAYQVSINTYTYDYGASINVSLDNPWQSWYGSYVSTGQLNFSGGSYYNFSVSTSCGYY
jgi:hypothetical protein